MKKETIQKKAFKLLDECIKSKIYVSYLSVLNTMYETATSEKQYYKAQLINELIIDEINS